MSDNDNANNPGRMILGIILLVLGVSWLFSNMGGIIFFIAALAFFAMLARSDQWSNVRGMFSQSADEIGEFFSEMQETRQETQAKTERDAAQRARTRAFLREQQDERSESQGKQSKQRNRPLGATHRIAAQAVRNAGNDPRDLTVAPVDIGMLAYEEPGTTPTLYRETKLPDDIEYVRPFMVLRSPQRAQGKIRFELVDGDGTRRFVDETAWELKQGETFVYPETWLPVDNLGDPDGEWNLRVYAAGILLADHEFMWRDEGGGSFRGYLTGDGEISDDLIEELSGARLGRLSLDDLLDEQDGGVIEFDPEAEAAARRNAMINRQQNRPR